MSVVTGNSTKEPREKLETDEDIKPVSVHRRLYTFDDINTHYAKDVDAGSHGCAKFIPKVECNRYTPWNILITLFPVVNVIRTYKIRQNVLLDILSGLSAGFMHFPQGLGFGLLAGLTPIYGLYSTFFPVLFYVLFGTSRHVSFGTNAVLALLTANILESEYGSASNVVTEPNSTQVVNVTAVPDINHTTTTEIFDGDVMSLLERKAATAAMASIVAGFLLLGMGILRLGFLTSYMSTSFVGGFTTAAAFHIATSQVSKMLGVKVKAHAGAGKLVKTYIDIFSDIANTNIASLVTSVVCLIVLLLVKICINERYKTKLPFPVPIDLLIVVVGTVISHFAKFNHNFDVQIVGVIPTGIPAPSLPDFSTADKHVVEALVIGILAFAMTISMAKLCCNIHEYSIDNNQELVSYGLCNILSSFFTAFPSCVAPPRTMILSSMGAKTTLNGVSTAVLILSILLVIGQLFESLPVCVLAAMIVASMKDLLLQFRTLPRLWRINVFDFIIWTVTCSVSIFVDLDIGLAAGILVSIFTVIIQNQLAGGHVIGVPEDDMIFIDQAERSKVSNREGIRIFRFNSALYFATAEKFKKQLYEKCLNPMEIKDRSSVLDVNQSGGTAVESHGDLSFIVLDCSAFIYLDLAGVNVLQQVVKQYKSVGISVYFARCSKLFVRTLTTAGFFETFDRERVFYEIHDALISCERLLPLPLKEIVSPDQIATKL